MTSPMMIRTSDDATKLWVHEASRVFADRLINNEDTEWYQELVIELTGRWFK